MTQTTPQPASVVPWRVRPAGVLARIDGDPALNPHGRQPWSEAERPGDAVHTA